MKTTIGIMTVAALGLHAQVGVGGGGGVGRSGNADAETMVTAMMQQQFQQAGTMGAVATPRAVVAGGRGQAVAGRPVSGTEQHSSTQTLGDGTVIASSETNQFYRDGSGRTRIETPSQNRVVITDPVAGYTITLNTETKTARKMPVNSMVPAIAGKIAVGGGVMSTSATFTTTVSNGGVPSTVTTGGPLMAARGRGGAEGGTLAKVSQNMKHEDLGPQSQDGVLANGTRDTMTIPQGQIGNSKDIHVVNERWYSDDLQMLVKTLNSDPRFGDSTYEFSNVSRGEPDPALFQIPADYKVTEANQAVYSLQGKLEK